jgi:hypothetical protein
VYVDAAYRVVCLAGAVCTAWWMYRPGGPSKPWLPQEKTRLLAFWIEAGSVIVAVSVLAALVVLLIEWWFIR